MDNRVTVPSASAKPVRSKSTSTSRFAASASQPQPSTDVRLGSTGGSTTRAGQKLAGPTGRSKKGLPATPPAEDGGADWKSGLRDEVWGLQDRVREITLDKAARACGYSIVEGASTLMKGAGQAYFGGLSTCAKIHLCPVCAGRIRSGRADELQTYVEAWETAGHGVAMVTLTMRHFERHVLKDLVKIQHAAWSRSFGAKGGKMWVRMKDQFGILGYARAWEVTRGPNGWHPHFHVLLFLDTPWTERTAAEFSIAAYTRWAAALEKEGGYRPSEKHGVRVDVPGAAEAPLGEMSEGVRLARYLIKSGEGQASWALGAEMTRGDVKSGRKAGRRTPFEIVADSADETRDERLRKQDVMIWREFEEGSHMVRALVYSSKIKDLLKDLIEVEEISDADLAAPDDPAASAVAVFPSETWYTHIAPKRGRRLELVHAAERNGQESVRRLIERWGLEWGVDVLPPTQVEEIAETRILPNRSDRSGWDARRSDARLDVPEPRGGERAAAPVQEALAVAEEPDALSVERLAEIRAEMVSANREVAAAGIARLRAQGRLSPIQD